MSQQPDISRGLERRVEEAEVHKVGRKYRVVGFGPRKAKLFREHGDMIHIGSGTDTMITGTLLTVTVKTKVKDLFIRQETLPETGVVIIHITGG